MEDEDMKYCKVCLVTDCKMFSSPSISEAYSQLVQDYCTDYNMYVCYECKYLLSKCQEFRSKCMTALNVLSSIHMDHSKIPKTIVRGIDRKHFKLESKVSRSSMLLVCNGNQQIVTTEINLDSAVKIEIDPDVLEDNKSETKFSIYAEGGDAFSVSDIKIDTNPEIAIDTNPLGDNKCEKKFNIDAKDVFYDVEMQDTYYPNEIIQSSQAPNNIVPEIKSEQKCQLKSKKTKENVPKRIKTLKRITKTQNLDALPLKASRCRPSQKMIQNYATIDEMTPSEAKEEMLLRKESRNYKTNPYSCDLCYKGFTLESTYNNHMKLHSPDSGTLECEFCHLLFRTRYILLKHIAGCHKYKITCKSCSYVCFSLGQAKTHIALHKGETYACEQCGMSFRLSNTLANHKRRKHPEFVCAHCGSMFSGLAGLNVHKSRTHNQDSTELLGPKCEECDVQFATETAWKRHLVISSKHSVSYGCEECGESFLTANELRCHGKEHPRRLGSAHNAKVAEAYKTEPKFKPAVCKLCDKRLETYLEYTEHMKSEHPNTTAAKEVLRRQAEVDNMLNICETCGKEFKSRLLLKYHTIKHTGELPYECDQCDKKYAYPASLYQHKIHYHSGGPRFTCDVCQKTFHVKAVLRKHMKIVHLGIRQFHCTICNKSCGHPCEVRAHMEYVHFKKPWPKRDRTKRRNKKD